MLRSRFGIERGPLFVFDTLNIYLYVLLCKMGLIEYSMDLHVASQPSGAEATVIIPTFGHAEFIIWAIKSARQQTITDIEILVVGDGASPPTRDVVEREAKNDDRIHFLDYPKGPRNGELYRHQAILQSKGQIICYLGHDDLWFPEHVETMLRLLKNADFVHSMHTYVAEDGTIRGFLPLVTDASSRLRMLTNNWNRFGPTCAAHTRDIYFDLPYGWRPAPYTTWSDLYMWRQFISLPKCRFSGVPETTAISFPRSRRQACSVEKRESEIAAWFPRLSIQDEAKRLGEMAVQNAAVDLQNEINNLERTGAGNPEIMPASKGARPSTFSFLPGKIYIALNQLIPGKSEAFKQWIVEQMIARSGLFDRNFYQERYCKNISTGKFNSIRHYLDVGWKSGANPSPDFDAAYYLATNEDVLKAGINPLVHYILYGSREKRVSIKVSD